MDRISYECAKEVNPALAHVCLCLNRHVKCWRYPESSNGGHASAPYIDDLNCDDDPSDRYDDTFIAPTFEEMRKILDHYKPGIAILVEFEAIEAIDEYAYKLAEFVKEKRKLMYG